MGQSLLRAWDIEAPVQLFVATLEPLVEAVSQPARARVPGRFPPVRRDLAFFVPRGATHAQVHRSLAGAAGDALSSLDLFDVYEGPGTPQGMKSLAFALQLHSPGRTLTEAEVLEIQSRMVAAVARECGGQLREQ